MTLEYAEKNYPYLLTCNFLDLISMEMQHMTWLSEHKDDKVEKDLETIKLIKNSRMGKNSESN